MLPTAARRAGGMAGEESNTKSAGNIEGVLVERRSGASLFLNIAMPVRTAILDRRLLMRRCVACGFDGEELLGGPTSRCPQCGCDLHERPARSYAEMEGLVGMPLVRPVESLPSIRKPALERWLAFLVLTGACLITIIYLATSMLA